MISCNHYDYIEIVCMYRYPIQLTMRTGEMIKGVALDTTRNDAREECIKLTCEEVTKQIVLDEIVTLTVCIDNPHFNEVSF